MVLAVNANAPQVQQHPRGRRKTVVAISPSNQSSAPAFSLATLRAVLAAMEAAHPEYGQRPVHAANIVAVRRIEATASGTFWVQSECDPTREYWVCPLPVFHLWRCTCQDYQRRGGPCKHALAVQLLQACEQRQAEQNAAESPILFPARAYSDDARFELTPLGHAVLAGQEPNPAA
jgi:hypothetical protein